MRYLILLLALALCAVPPCAAQSLFAISPAFRVYTDANGQPLNNGYIYFGTAGQNAETNPITVYWDVAGTIPAAQPIRTVNGYPSRNGTPANVFVAGDHSVTVRSQNRAIVFTASQSLDLLLAGAILGSAGGAVNIGITDAGGFYTGTNVEAALQEKAGLSRLQTEVLNLLLPTGTVLDYVGSGAAASTPPQFFVFADSRTIGNLSSGATARANADTEALFTLLWENWGNTELPIQDSGGTPTTRGANAAADFAANKRMPTPDLRGRVTAGRDNMGNSTAGRITAAGGNFTATTMGAAGGAQNHQLTSAQMPSHTHPIAAHNHTITEPGGVGHQHQYLKGTLVSVQAGTGATVEGSGGTAALTDPQISAITINNNTGALVTNSAGGDGTHPIVQPTIVVTKIIKLIVPWEFLQ